MPIIHGHDILTVAISNHTTGDVIAAVANRYIVVVAGLLSLDAAGEFQLLSGATAKSGLVEVLADTPVPIHGPIVCGLGEAFKATATAAANGWASYYLVG